MDESHFSANGETSADEKGGLFDAAEIELRALVEYSPIGIAIIKNRIIVRANQTLCSLFGYSRDELVGASTRLIYPNDAEFERLGRELYSHAGRRASSALEFVAQHKDGHAIEAIVRLAFLRPADPSAGAVCMVTDITEHVRVEQRLREKDRQLATLMSNLPGMAYRCANDDAWTMELVSPGSLALTGYTPDELIGNRSLSYADLIFEEDRAGVWEGVQAALAKRERFQITYRIRARDQSVRWVWEQGLGVFNSSGRLEAVEGLIIDTTRQHHIETNLRASEEKYRSMFEHSVAGIFQIDAQGRYRSVNPALVKMHGYSSTEEMIREVTSVGTQIYARPEDRPALLEKLQTEGRVNNFELEVRRKDGERFWILLNASVVRDDAGKLLYIEGTNVDITERKRAEALLKAKAEAEAASRAKSAFLTHMSHELRTPMNAVLGFCQLLLRDSTLNEKHRDYLQTIDRNGQHLLGIINNILEMAKIDANRLTFAFNRFSLPLLFQDLRSTFTVRAERKNLALQFHIEPGFPAELWADRIKVRQILVNLIGNALKFTKHGEVTVRARLAKGNERTDFAYLEVADTGCGIADADLDRLFEPFEQTATSAIFGGTGLGLPISREYAHGMHGSLTVRSADGEGSVFCLALPQPIVEAAREIDRKTPVSSELPRARPGLRILVADDIEDNRRLLCRLLSEVGYEVRDVESGLAAMREHSGWKPHCILMDAKMPGIDGLEAIRRIRKVDQERVKILVLSAGASLTQRSDAIAAGADDFLAKPFQPEDLLSRLQNWLEPSVLAESESCASHAASLEPDLKASLQAALIEADLEKISSLVEQVGSVEPALAAEFSSMAERFDFEAIRRALEHV